MTASLPVQRLPLRLKGKDWQKDTIDYYDRLTYSTTTSIRNTNFTKKVNYDLFNGIFNKADLEYVCNPLGLKDNEFPAQLQHYDIISPALNLLIGEETKRSDNCIVISASTNDINRKQGNLKKKLVELLQQKLIAEIDPSTIDPNQPLPTPEQIIKYEKHNISDIVESKANKLLKHLRKYLNTKEVFKKGWKDALITGEEIYYTGVSGNDVIFRRCNPLNTTVVLDGDTDYIDDALAIVEVRMLAPSTILDEFGKDIEPDQLKRLEELCKRYVSGVNRTNNNPTFVLDKTTGGVTDVGLTGSSLVNTTSGGLNSNLIRVARVEWKSFKKLYDLSYTDENGTPVEEIVDEAFNITIFKEVYPDAKVEEFWINEAWEGIKIDSDIYIHVQAKPNQRRRMDNPYYCKLGYTGLIYNAVNSISTSLIDRIKPYQYLYNVIAYRLELAFASDQGKIMLMDLAQIPRSEGIDIDRWMYYMKAMKIAFVNSHEEGRKGSMTGKISQFNQFQSIDLSLASTIQQYIQTLDYIKQQVSFISGVSPQRLGAIENRELVGNVERSVQQSALITEVWFDSHDEVKRRVYTALVECAKVAYKDGMKAQYILDDMTLETLDMEEFEFEDSEFNVFMSNSSKDLMVLETLKQLSQAALNSDKADLSVIIDTIINDNPADIVRLLQRNEQMRRENEQQMQQQQLQSQKEQQEMILADKQADRDLKQYEIDQNNITKLQTAQISALGYAEDTDINDNMIPDVIEQGKLALDNQKLASDTFMKKMTEENKLKMNNDKINLEKEKLKSKEKIEELKIKQTEVQNKSQEKIARETNKLKEKEIAVKKIAARKKPSK